MYRSSIVLIKTGSIIFGVADGVTPFFHSIKKKRHLVSLLLPCYSIKKTESIDLINHSYFTKKLLTIKAKNSFFPEDDFEEVNLSRIMSFVFNGILSYQSTFTLKTSIIQKNCYISSHTKHAAALNTQNKISSLTSLAAIRSLIQR